MTLKPRPAKKDRRNSGPNSSRAFVITDETLLAIACRHMHPAYIPLAEHMLLVFIIDGQQECLRDVASRQAGD